MNDAAPLASSPAAPAKIELREVTKTFAAREGLLLAVGPISITAQEGEFVALVGPSGCGKTTLLNLVAGFVAPTTGEITLDGARIVKPGADRVMIFQEPALFPWLDVFDNVAFGLRRAQMTRSDLDLVVRQLLSEVHLDGFEHALVHELSGGMKQRVALARALALNPGVLLCDEPFGSLDALTRERLYAHVQELLGQTRNTVLFVTHNTREAACLADRVVVLSGRPAHVRAVVEVGLPRPRDFYDPEVSRLAGHILAELRSEIDEGWSNDAAS
jgi:NitT/TauT family transport system ATP-binding protein